MQTAERALRPFRSGRAQRQAIARANHFIREGAYLDGLRSLREGSFGSRARSAFGRLQTGLREIFVSHAVTVAAARGLAWPTEQIISLSGVSPRVPPDAAPLLHWLQEVAPTEADVEPEKSPVDTLRDMAADAVRRGDARWGARLYEESLKKIVPASRVHDSAYVRGTAPPPIGSLEETQAGAIADPAQIRKLMANGDYAQAIALATQHFKATGNVARLSQLHAALSEIATSGQVLRDAAVRLGRRESDVLPLQLCRAATCGEEGRSWQQWLSRALPTWAGGDPEPVDALLGCARARLAAGSNINAVTAALPRSTAGSWRSRLIEAEAARAGGEIRWAAQLLGEVSHGAPQVTPAHRRLGQMAYLEGRGCEAAAHFERAMLSPNAGELMADQAETIPCRMITLRNNSDLYCLHGKLFIVRRDTNMIGIKVFAGRPFVIRNTPGFRQARRLAAMVRLGRFRGPPPERQWLLTRTHVPSIRSSTFRNRAGGAIARWTPSQLRVRLSPFVRYVHWQVLSPCKHFAIKSATSAVSGVAHMLRLAAVAVLRHWVKAEPVEFLSADNVQSVFEALKEPGRRSRSGRR